MISRHSVKRAAAVLLAILLVTAAWPVMSLAETTPVFNADFEDGTTQGFEKREDRDTSVLEVSDADAHGGGKSLKTTGRTQSWNGPSVRIDSFVEEEKEYTISVWVRSIKPTSATSFTLSTQIGGADGATYVNITDKMVSDADGWVQLTGTYMYTNTSSDYITIYVENGDPTAEYYIDNVTVSELEGGGINTDLSAPSLKDVYKDYFLIGNVFSSQDLSGTRFDLLKHHYDVLTAENAMKPDAMSPSKDTYSFDAVDGMLETIEAAGIMVHGHTLGWHQQSAAWLNRKGSNALTRAEAEANLKAFVSSVAGHYAGKLLSWDVVNEAMNDNPPNPDDWRDSLRLSPWYQAFENEAGDGQSGADYIEAFFRAAREADPDAKLYYNDYNLDNQNKSTAVANMVKELNDKYLAEGNTRLLIDGIGMQGHYNTDTILEDVEASIERFEAIGVEISITELDITVTGISEDTGLTEKGALKQASVYAKLFLILKNHADSIARVTFWGLDDGSSWRSSQYPQIFDKYLSAKPAFDAVIDPEGFLETYVEEDAGGRTGTAVYGTPAIDGTVDDIWEKAEKLPIEIMLQAWNTASGAARVLWDEDNLYVLFEVSDTALDNTARYAYEQDSVEAFVDESNCKQGSYKDDDGQYRVGYDGTQSFGNDKYNTGFESAVSVDGVSYVVEMKIPFKVHKPEVGALIGFDAQINDGEDGKRIGISKWSDPTDNSFQNTTKWGVLELLNELPTPTPEPTPEPTPTPTPSPEPEPSSSKETGSNNWVFIVIVSVIALGGVAGFVMLMRKK